MRLNIDDNLVNGKEDRARKPSWRGKGLVSAAGVLAILATLIALKMLGTPFPVWVAPSLVRVGKTDGPGTASSIVLSGARGETVDTQVIVRAPLGGLTNVNISASALT